MITEEIHHITGRHGHGLTGFAKGMPLFGFHNRLMENGWDIRYDDQRTPWLTPSATPDPTRTPIRGSALTDRRAD